MGNWEEMGKRRASQVVLAEKNPPANAGNMGSIPELGGSPGEGNGKPLQYSCLKKFHGQGEPGGLQSKRLQRARHN